jgi:hypothetical protein
MALASAQADARDPGLAWELAACAVRHQHAGALAVANDMLSGGVGGAEPSKRRRA